MLVAASSHLKTLATRTTDPERTVKIMVMQRIAEKDPAGEWLASGKPLRHICLPGELIKDEQTGIIGKQVRPAYLKEEYIDGLLDPIRRPRPVLRDLKIALGSYAYAGQVQQLPAPDEGGILKKAWFRTISYPDFLKVPGASNAIWHGDADTAYTDQQKNDPSALLVSAYIGQTLYVSFVEEMWLELPGLKKKLPELLATHGATTAQSKLHVEPKASGKSVVQELKVLPSSTWSRRLRPMAMSAAASTRPAPSSRRAAWCSSMAAGMRSSSTRRLPFRPRRTMTCSTASRRPSAATSRLVASQSLPTNLSSLSNVPALPPTHPAALPLGLPVLQPLLATR
jgi:phage terminase large subunit-like protein